ncbi:uncharacterized protein CXQ87_003396 [Candidozyma duobushaemuli]|uniref:HTH CENPB-type domain-containing protein n=2 Tax=Candidozyma TaxID=3303203 RepID=A0ABX8IA69_9ASCO|nr:uncharacterized protein CXQ87_003396 [[Candida] duobushaemulonis]PVH15553.1 hypothetical protein CXQ87_003396 [[Candida] duobushaemulonis]QWU88758.1 hypothetical protein CA3LBN_003066 [[Candida] haemuloni]
MKTKERLPRATLEQKIQILDYFHSSDRPQSDTVEKFKDMVAISTSTFNEWVKREDEYRDRYKQSEGGFGKHSKRKSSYKYDKINRAMDLLVQQRLDRNESVTEPLLRDYWQVYAHQFGVDNPKRLISFSHGWLSQFKKRHGLLRKKGSKNDLTRVTNERLLAEQVTSEGSDFSADESSSDEEEPKQKKKKSAFRPQDTLSFQNQFSYTERKSPQRDRLGVLPVTTKPVAGDIEKFLFNVADEFFNEHQYEYPQTIKMYHEFKSSFLSERLIDLRSKDEADGSQNEKLLSDHRLLPGSQLSQKPEKRRRLEQIPQQIRQQLPQPNLFGQSSSSRSGNSEILDNMFMRRQNVEDYRFQHGQQLEQRQEKPSEGEEVWNNSRKMWERNKIML